MTGQKDEAERFRSLETLAVAALVTAATYLVFGTTGFGSTVLALPLLAHLVPIKFAVSLLLLLDFAAKS